MNKQKDPTFKQETLPNGMIRREGRTGTATEYVEFQPAGAQTVYIAKKGSGGHYFIFRSEPGRNGSVETLGDASDLFSAIKFAEFKANGGVLPGETEE